MNEFLNYSLFLDVDEPGIRDRNRGVVMLNIYEDHCRNGTFSAAGVASMLGYFKEIPEEERQAALDIFGALCQQRGYVEPITEH